MERVTYHWCDFCKGSGFCAWETYYSDKVSELSLQIHYPLIADFKCEHFESAED